jgi:ABC-type transporter Mla subunit MlaD
VVTQAPKRSAVLAALAFALSCVGLIIFTWTQFGGTIPFAAQGYRIHGLFTETGLLVPNADVRIAGVNVGKVTAVEARGLKSYVTMDVGRQYAPLPVDTRAIVRQKTLLGEAYVMLSTGTGTGPKLPDGGVIPSTQIETTNQLDQVLGSFDKPTQRDLQAFLEGTFVSLAARGQDLNDAIGNLDPAAGQLNSLLGVLDHQQGNLHTLTRGFAAVFTELGNRSADIRTLITAGDQVLSATAARNVELTASVNALPPFLSELRTTLSTLDTTLALAGPPLHTLRGVAPIVIPTLRKVIALSGPALRLLHQAPGLVDAAAGALPSIARFSRAFKPAIDTLLPAAREVVPLIGFIALFKQELAAAMANLAATLQGVAPAATTQSVGGTPAGMAHYLRALIPLNNESVFGQSVREPTNRHNSYYSPGEQYNLANGLLSSDCSNTSDQSQVPVLNGSGNVPCRVQPGYTVGGLTAYYPHVTRAPLPK